MTRLVFLLVATLLLVGCGGDTPDDPSGPEATEGADGTPDSEDPGEASGDAEAFYEGKTIEWLVPFGPGGGNDTQSRFMQPFLTEHIPGNPTIQVTNEGGGGSIPGTNEFALNRDPDGETVLYSSASTNLNYLMRAPGVEFDYRDFEPLFVIPSGRVTYIATSTGVESVEDLAELDETLIFGAQSATGADALNLIAFELLELDINPVIGYEGSGAIQIAFQQGEVTIDAQTTPTYFQDVEPLVEEGSAVPLFTSGQLDQSGDLVRDPAFPDLPTVGEAYETLHGEPPSGDIWEAYKALVAGANSYAKVAWLHADAPPEAAAALREGLRGMLDDPDFQAEAPEIIGDYEIIVGEDLGPAIEQGLLSVPDSVIEWVLNFLETEYGVER